LPGSILAITPIPTHPVDAGHRVRIFRMLRHLKNRGFKVHVAVAPLEARIDLATMEEAWDGVTVLPYRRRATPSGVDLPIDAWYDPGIEPALVELQHAHTFENILVEYVFFSRALELFGPGVRKILDTHDVFAGRQQMYEQGGLDPEFFSTSAAEESKGLARADLVLAIQDRERDLFAGLVDTKVITAGHMVEIRPLPPAQTVRKLLFVGSRQSLNLEGLNWFLEEVWPAVALRHPSMVLEVAGSICERIEPATDGVRLLGVVPDLLETYTGADVVISPVRLGTGLKIKTIEALGYGKPVIAMPAAVEGLESGDGTAFLTAKSAPMFRALLGELIQDADLRLKLARNAADFAQEYNREALREFVDILQS